MSLLSRHIETYDFYRGTRHWRYTDTDRLAIVEAQTYTPVPIKRGRIVQSPEEGKNGLELTVPATLPLLDEYRPFPPLSRIHLNVKRIRINDGFVSSAWMGVVADIDDSDISTVTITCQTLMAAMGANGLRRVWQVPCGLPLYSAGLGMCNVNQDDFRADATLTGVAGVTVMASVFAAQVDGYYAGGFIRWQTGTDVEHRFIVSHVGDTLQLLTPCTLPVGSVVASFPGCDHTKLTCDDKFDNVINYGGQHTIPKKNAFEDPVF